MSCHVNLASGAGLVIQLDVLGLFKVDSEAELSAGGGLMLGTGTPGLVLSLCKVHDFPSNSPQDTPK